MNNKCDTFKCPAEAVWDIFGHEYGAETYKWHRYCDKCKNEIPEDKIAIAKRIYEDSRTDKT